MPVMDGITASKEILNYCILNNMSAPNILAVTAYENHENQKRCLEAGI